MIIDKFLQLSDKQTVSATAPSTHEVDLGQPTPNLGLNSQPLYVVITVAEAASGAGKINFALQHSDTAGSGYADALNGVVPAADLKAGAQVVLPMPVKHKRFVRLNYTVDGAVGRRCVVLRSTAQAGRRHTTLYRAAGEPCLYPAGRGVFRRLRLELLRRGGKRNSGARTLGRRDGGDTGGRRGAAGNAGARWQD